MVNFESTMAWLFGEMSSFSCCLQNSVVGAYVVCVNYYYFTKINNCHNTQKDVNISLYKSYTEPTEPPTTTPEPTIDPRSSGKRNINRSITLNVQINGSHSNPYNNEDSI